MSELRDEPSRSLEDPREILLQQLSYYRATLLAKLDGLNQEQLRSSRQRSAGSSPTCCRSTRGTSGTLFLSCSRIAL
jgi:hypothetical protein